MNATIATLLGGALLAAAPASAQAADPGACTAATQTRLMVTVRGLKNSTGKVRVQLYDGAGFLKKGRWLGRVEAPAREGATICIAVPRAGDYAVAVIHDENGNKKLDTFAGIPKEGFGFSRNPAIRFGPPRVAAARFSLTTDAEEQQIRMRYML